MTRVAWACSRRWGHPGLPAFRFQWKFAVGAIVSLIHDVVVTLGILSFFQITFDLTVLAAVPAIIGYSLNDTIVVFDRVRENFRVMRKASLIENINVSTTQTLLRTIATSVSTLLAIAALLFFGGDNLFGFSWRCSSVSWRVPTRRSTSPTWC